MRHYFPFGTRIVAGLLVVICARAEIEQVDLKSGWNAVYLLVDPLELDPDQLFAGTPITKVNAFFPSVTDTQFIQDSDEQIFNQADWRFWVPEDSPEAVVRDLGRVNGNQAYMVYATNDFTWQIEGNLIPVQPTWRPNSFSFAGFDLPPGSVSSTPLQNLIDSEQVTAYQFRTDSNHWEQVSLSTPVQRGELIAFKSGLSNPLNQPVALSGIGFDGTIDFGTYSARRHLILSNTSSARISPQIQLVGDTLPIRVEQGVEGLESDEIRHELSGTIELGSLAPGTSLVLRFVLLRQQLAENLNSGVRITDGQTYRVTVPIQAEVAP